MCTFKYTCHFFFCVYIDRPTNDDMCTMSTQERGLPPKNRILTLHRNTLSFTRAFLIRDKTTVYSVYIYILYRCIEMYLVTSKMIIDSLNIIL